MRSRTGAIADTGLLAEAAAWHERLLGAGDATRAAFAAWRDRSPEHAEAYRRVAEAHVQARSLAAEGPLLALRHEAVTRAMLVRTPPRIRPKVVAAALLLLAGAPLAAFGLHLWSPPKADQVGGETFRTGIGQRADVTLPDGSTVTLDTATRLEVRYAGGARRVRLEGQGWFRLAPSTRPFVVTAGGHDFTATGGTFDLRTDPDQVRVFADGGAIGMVDGDAAIAIEPGRLLAARGNDVTIRRLADPIAFTGWRGGLLQFQDVPLAAAAAELNRYRVHPIRIADSRAATLRVSGTFHTAETPAFVDALTAGFPVRGKQDSSGDVVIASR
jgi:transmembrane sensor